MDVRGLMRRSAQHYAERTAVVSGDRRLTYAEAWTRGLRLANGLLALGLDPGDRVAVLEDNSVEAQDMYAGAAAAGLVRVPLYARDARRAHADNMAGTGCRALVVAQRYLPDVAGLVDELPDLEHVIVRDGGYEDWLAAQPDSDPDPRIEPDDYFIIRHTGGTTGRAKGVANTHRTWLASGRDWTYNLPPVQVGDVCMHVGPISHGSGYLYLPMWLQGAVNVLLPAADPGECLEAMDREGVGYMFCVPALLGALARHPDARRSDFSALKVILVAGAPISDATALAARDLFGPVLYQLYGQTEALPACAMGPQEWFSTVEGSNPLRSAGRPLPFAELEIRGPDNESLPFGQEGQIAIRCEGQMTGFWNDPEKTAARLVDGWVLSGDVGTMDANGYLYVLDRMDDMIISGGFNIWPAELENVIASHPAVREVAAFGVPHERWGETPMAVCVTDPGAAVTEQEIIDLAARALGSYKKPSRVEFRTEELPKSPVGKLQRKALREPHWADMERRVSGV